MELTLTYLKSWFQSLYYMNSLGCNFVVSLLFLGRDPIQALQIFSSLTIKPKIKLFLDKIELNVFQTQGIKLMLFI